MRPCPSEVRTSPLKNPAPLGWPDGSTDHGRPTLIKKLQTEVRAFSHVAVTVQSSQLINRDSGTGGGCSGGASVAVD